MDPRYSIECLHLRFDGMAKTKAQDVPPTVTATGLIFSELFRCEPTKIRFIKVTIKIRDLFNVIKVLSIT